MNIHFICSSNVYRSRLAEAYLKSKNLEGISASSSGTNAHMNCCGPICWEAQWILETYGLTKFTSLTWTQTTQEVLEIADRLILMENYHLEYITKNLGYRGKNYEIWNIPDMDELHTDTEEEVLDMIRKSKETFMLIREKVDNLVSYLEQGQS